jgi:predicted nucleic acid-binding protein
MVALRQDCPPPRVMVQIRAERYRRGLAEVALGVRLVTNNATEFELVAALKIENWTLPIRPRRR